MNKSKEMYSEAQTENAVIFVINIRKIQIHI